MHVLFVVPYAPNLIRTRPYNLIRALRRDGHAVTLLTLHSSEAERDGLAALRNEGVTVFSEPLSRARSLANSVAAIPSAGPLQARYCWQPALARRLAGLLAPTAERPPVDVVHVEHLRGARYALHAREIAAHSDIPVVWDSVDCISHLFRQAATHSAGRAGRWMTRLELPRTERYEGWLAWQFDAVLTTSAVDRAALAALAAAHRSGAPPIEVLPNGVDLDYFRPDPSVARDPNTLVLSGKMSYHANVSMAVYLVREIMPRVWSRRPEARVVIAGKDPARAVRALAGHPAVTVTGAVGDMRPHLRGAALAVAPITYGAGIQNKILEAMACGTPVVTTPTALNALSAVPDRDLLVGRDAGELAAAIIALLEDSQHRAAVGRAGREYAAQAHDWQTLTRHLVAIYKNTPPENL